MDTRDRPFTPAELADLDQWHARVKALSEPSIRAMGRLYDSGLTAAEVAGYLLRDATEDPWDYKKAVVVTAYVIAELGYLRHQLRRAGVVIE